MLTSAEAAVLDLVDERALLADLSALVAFRSLGGEETPAQEWMAGRLADLGLQVDTWSIDFTALRLHRAFSMEVPRERGVGVVGTLGDGPGPTLILNGHIDVVPIGDLSQWSVDPWQATVRDGCVLGRGTCDMKGGLAAALAAIRALRWSGTRLATRVAIHSVIAEEDGGAGTLAALLRGHTGDGAISMEPTEMMLAPAHAGALSFRISVPGRSAHGCVRNEGISAIETFRLVHDALLAFEAQRNHVLRTPLFESYPLPFALSIGTLHAGDWPSSVPDRLVCEGRYGIAPGEDEAEARRSFEAVVSRAAERHPFLREHPPAVEWWGGQFLPARTDPSALIVTTTAAAIGAVTGRTPIVRGMPYGADMRLLVNEGRVPAVLFGAGNVRHAHRPDEFVPIADLLTVARVLALVAMRFGT